MQITFNRISPKHIAWIKKGSLALAALTLGVQTAYAASTFDQPDPDFTGMVNAMGANYAGSKATLNGRSFHPGQEVQLLQNGQTLTQAPLIADEQGNFSTNITLPAQAKSGQHFVVIQASKPSAASVFKLKVSTKIAESGQDKFTVTSEPLVPGVYQSAYSPASNSLFVTSAVGRPPVRASKLLKVDPDTLKVVQEITPAAQPGRDDGQVNAVYGVGVDDTHGTVWVTNTRSGSVAVYKQSDLSLIKQFDNGVTGHARDVVIDTTRNRAYVSTPGAPTIAVLDSQTLDVLPAIDLKSKTRDTPSPLSLALDEQAGKLYTVSMSTNELFVIDLHKNEALVYPLPGANNASGVAVDSKRGQVYIASQGSDNVLIVDARNGKVLHNIEVGAGAVNVAFDATTDVAYVANRGAGTLTVLSPKGDIMANLKVGTFPNHVALDGKGNAYLLNKSRGKDDNSGDRISRIQLKK